ncbi:MAG: hypothetical protein R3F02_00010 [Thiolinea sp.]
MNARYFLLTSTLLLAACGADTEVQVTTGQDSSATSIKTEVSAPDTQQAGTGSYKPVGNPAIEATEATDSTTDNSIANRQVAAATTDGVSPASGPLLPLGRLIGIVDTEDYRQATIDNQGRVLRLREGDDWQGWTIKSIGRKNIVISQDNAEHSLLLLTEFRAPEPVQRLSEELSEQEGDAVSPPFTQRQLTELRSRLMMGRSDN